MKGLDFQIPNEEPRFSNITLSVELASIEQFINNSDILL